LIAGVVLAAGGASRFGSAKQLAELDGMPLLQHAIDAVLAVPAVDPVVVVLGASADRVREAVSFDGAAAPLRAARPGRDATTPLRAARPGRDATTPLRAARAVVCDEWAEGMAASLRCGVEAVGDADWVIVTLGDQPRVSAEVIAAVADQAASAPEGVDAVRPTYGGVPGHPVALSRAMLRGVAELRGDVGARDLLGSASVRTFEAGGLSDPADVDTPEELEGLRT
jgi:molybdenum cofactor cytidylyltransferase